MQVYISFEQVRKEIEESNEGVNRFIATLQDSNMTFDDLKSSKLFCCKVDNCDTIIVKLERSNVALYRITESSSNLTKVCNDIGMKSIGDFISTFQYEIRE